VWLHLTSSVWSVVWWGDHTGYFTHDIYTPVTYVLTFDIKCMTCGFISCLDRILYTWYIYTSNMSTYIWHQVYELWFYQLSRQDTLHMIYIHQYHVCLHLTSIVWAVVWWGDHTWYFTHDIYTPVTCLLTSDIKCMSCGFISCLDRILYTWYIYTSSMCAYIWHQVYELWFDEVTIRDTLHMIYIHQ
jgi:hypothetical protein